MAYNFNKSGGTPITVNDNTVGSTPALSVKLIGKNYQGYGRVMAETIAHMLEHFAANSAPANPTQGQLWFDSTGTGKLKVYSGSTWREIVGSGGTGSITEIYGDIIPSPNCTGATTNCDGGGTGVDLGSPSNRFCNVFASNFCGTASSARYADLAERYEADQEYEMGTLVKIGGLKEITQTTVEFDEEVFGIISTQPGMMLNADAGNHITHPYVGLSGRVPTKVIGSAMKGQRLVSSDIPGVARAVSRLEKISPFMVVGRALVDKEDNKLGKILVSIGAK